MLHEQDFYDAFDSGHRPSARSILEKTEALFRLFETQVQVLLANRKARLDRQRSSLEGFLNSEFTVDQSQDEVRTVRQRKHEREIQASERSIYDP